MADRTVPWIIVNAPQCEAASSETRQRERPLTPYRQRQMLAHLPVCCHLSTRLDSTNKATSTTIAATPSCVSGAGVFPSLPFSSRAAPCSVTVRPIDQDSAPCPQRYSGTCVYTSDEVDSSEDSSEEEDVDEVVSMPCEESANLLSRREHSLLEGFVLEVSENSDRTSRKYPESGTARGSPSRLQGCRDLFRSGTNSGRAPHSESTFGDDEEGGTALGAHGEVAVSVRVALLEQEAKVGRAGEDSAIVSSTPPSPLVARTVRQLTPRRSPPTTTLLSPVVSTHPLRLSPSPSPASSPVRAMQDMVGGDVVYVNVINSTTQPVERADPTKLRLVLHTPLNYGETIQWYRDHQRARVTYQRATILIGECLLRGEVEGDAEGWMRHLVQMAADRELWRRRYPSVGARRSRDRRRPQGGLLSLGSWVRSLMMRCGDAVKLLLYPPPCCSHGAASMPPARASR